MFFFKMWYKFYSYIKYDNSINKVDKKIEDIIDSLSNSRKDIIYFDSLCLYLKEKKLKSEKVANFFTLVGDKYHHAGKYKKAKYLYIYALKIRKKLFKKEDSSIAQIYNNLAKLYQSMGKYRKAKFYYYKSLRGANLKTLNQKLIHF